MSCLAIDVKRGVEVEERQKIDRVVEIINYQLMPGTGYQFHQIMKTVSAPLHHDAGLEVLAFGNSLHDEDAYFLIRAFGSLTHMAASLGGFYESVTWKNGPRSHIMACIKTSSKSVLILDEAGSNALKSNYNSGSDTSE